MVLPAWEDARDKAKGGSPTRQRIEEILKKLDKTGDLIFPKKLNHYSGPKIHVTSRVTSTRKEEETPDVPKPQDTKKYSSDPYSLPKAPNDTRFTSLLDDL